MTTQPELLPSPKLITEPHPYPRPSCPFCGQQDGYSNGDRTICFDGNGYIYCENCGTEGPRGNGEKGSAEEKWVQFCTEYASRAAPVDGNKLIYQGLHALLGGKPDGEYCLSARVLQENGEHTTDGIYLVPSLAVEDETYNTYMLKKFAVNGEDSHHMVSESEGSLAHAQAVADAVVKAEAHGDVVAALERARDEACSCKGSMGRCIIHECYDDCISVVKAALHQPTEDEAVQMVHEAYKLGVERGEQATRLLFRIKNRALNRPVGGEK